MMKWKIQSLEQGIQPAALWYCCIPAHFSIPCPDPNTPYYLNLNTPFRPPP